VPERHRFDPAIVAHLGRLYDGVRPHIVQSHSVKSHALVRVSGLDRAAAWLAFHHGYTTTDWKVRAYNAIDRWSLRAARLVITTSRPFADALARRGVVRSKIRVLHNAVTEADLAVPGNGRDRERALTVLTVGRLSREKGHEVLLRALAVPSPPGLPPLSAIVAGEGPERSRLATLAASLGLRDTVHFHGNVAQPASLYDRADIFVLPSHSEGSPNALLEAMAAGLPVIATQVGGVAEIVEHDRTGLLVPPDDPHALAAALARLAGDRRLRRRLGDAARAHVRLACSLEARARALLGIYLGLVQPAAPPRREVA
jgi:glycosyltransferase involved in cell wall biosynthesis